MTGAVMAGTAVAVPLLTLATGREQAKPATLVIPEGWRASQIYDAIDKALKLSPGSTRTAVGKASLKLPNEARGNPEGYLFPATYPVRKGATPESMLQLMIDAADQKFNGAPVAAGAQRNAMNVYQAVTVASIVQAEASTKADMGKVARVIFNRLNSGMPLQMDSTLHYALNRNTADTSQSDSQEENPYNSHQRTGLPPTPIDNPGEDAMRAALNPTPGDWLYFVTIAPGETRFTADYNTHLRNVAEYQALHQNTGTAQPTGDGPPAPPSAPADAQPALR
ncbi:aminodeoxychorismate lyase [Streptomyces corchorusii]|uniref:Endolytic murein transglycosylase n=1 Tax=Streptomyces corchorusii TaxID=1903 RepID=A0A101PXG3_STRCK|nr:aminodeoxychorismate lyase [Streptomyces corchorusii]